ncbi:hypothetical protein CSHISOI_11821 [Colletotrichum shisoi]|uniref:Uncharacterized protein n=1 Tax=Colletotrichum shisoi TaxID=2078593 RepID=A0A5Q4BA18_9PEZI|nr:hypothetical protein CSHISOI_11821 [Colletotrichum shisoi]
MPCALRASRFFSRPGRQTDSTMAPLASHPEFGPNSPLRQISQLEQGRSPLSTLSSTTRLSKALIGRQTHLSETDVAGSGVKASVRMPPFFFLGGGGEGWMSVRKVISVIFLAEGDPPPPGPRTGARSRRGPATSPSPSPISQSISPIFFKGCQKHACCLLACPPPLATEPMIAGENGRVSVSLFQAAVNATTREGTCTCQYLGISIAQDSLLRFPPQLKLRARLRIVQVRQHRRRAKGKLVGPECLLQ